MLKMWRSDKGKEATRQSMVSVLKEMQRKGTPVRDIIDDIEKAELANEAMKTIIRRKEIEEMKLREEEAALKAATTRRKEEEKAAKAAIARRREEEEGEKIARKKREDEEAELKAAKEEATTKAPGKKYLHILGFWGILVVGASVCLHETLSQPFTCFLPTVDID